MENKIQLELYGNRFELIFKSNQFYMHYNGHRKLLQDGDTLAFSSCYDWDFQHDSSENIVPLSQSQYRGDPLHFLGNETDNLYPTTQKHFFDNFQEEIE